MSSQISPWGVLVGQPAGIRFFWQMNRQLWLGDSRIPGWRLNLLNFAKMASNLPKGFRSSTVYLDQGTLMHNFCRVQFVRRNWLNQKEGKPFFRFHMPLTKKITQTVVSSIYICLCVSNVMCVCVCINQSAIIMSIIFIWAEGLYPVCSNTHLPAMSCSIMLSAEN